jgi:hypothetical protein
MRYRDSSEASGTSEPTAPTRLAAVETNLLDDDGRLEPTWRPERRGYLWRRKRVAGEHLGAGLIELTPGESTFLDHYELGTVERVVVRRPPDAGRRARARGRRPRPLPERPPGATR